VLGNTVGLGNQILGDQTPPSVYFYGETLPLGQTRNTKRIYVASEEVTQPDSAVTVARLPDVFSTLDQFVSTSDTGNTIYRGTKEGAFGLFSGNANLAIATSAIGFSSTGAKPSINAKGTAAFYGVFESVLLPLPSIYLSIPGDGYPRIPGNLLPNTSRDDLLLLYGEAPNDFISTGRIALNNFNQVAFLGTDFTGNQAIFTTAFGQVRRLVAAGDILFTQGGELLVTGLSLENGLGTRGQVTFLANTADGNQFVIVANRAFNQQMPYYSAVIPRYRSQGYLLRSRNHPIFPYSDRTTIGFLGCNLTSTANVLNYFGAYTSPIEFQNWLLSQWDTVSSARKANYITSGPGQNDFSDKIVEEYSRYLVSQGKALRIVRFAGTHSVADGPNFKKILSELRAGRSVKIRVPSNSQKNPRYGHFVMAYGLIDPSKPDSSISSEDILIADPGAANDYTLAAYGQLGNPSFNDTFPNWLEDDDRLPGMYRRLYLYSAISRYSLTLDIWSPIEAVLTDSLERRAGFLSSTGALREIPGSDYYEELPYSALGDDGVPGDPVWDSNERVKHITISDVSEGDYNLQIVGTAAGNYTISLICDGGVTPDVASFAGSIVAGEKQTFVFSVARVKPQFMGILSLPNATTRLTVIGDATKLISIEMSTNLVEWRAMPSAQFTNGFGVLSITNHLDKTFFRAVQ
jgi:hypothetical protein